MLFSVKMEICTLSCFPGWSTPLSPVCVLVCICFCRRSTPVDAPRIASIYTPASRIFRLNRCGQRCLGMMHLSTVAGEELDCLARQNGSGPLKATRGTEERRGVPRKRERFVIRGGISLHLGVFTVRTCGRFVSRTSFSRRQ